MMRRDVVAGRARGLGFALVLTVILLIANELARSSFGAGDRGRRTWPTSLLSRWQPWPQRPPCRAGGGGGIDISIGPLLNLVSIIIVGVLIPHGLGSIWVGCTDRARARCNGGRHQRRACRCVSLPNGARDAVRPLCTERNRPCHPGVRQLRAQPRG